MEKIDISGVPETMVQTLYARAKESRRRNALIHDDKAVEMVDRMDYDFSFADKDLAMGAGVIARTMLLDDMVGEFVASNPDCTVINIACGMDMRFWRMDNGRIRWHDIDLPETIDVRRRFVEDTDRVKMHAFSAMDEAWAAEVGPIDGPVLVIVEGLTMYLSAEDVARILSIVRDRYARATLFVEFLNPRFVGKDVERSISKNNARFTFGARSGAELVAGIDGLRHVADRSLSEKMPLINPVYRLLIKVPAIANLSNKIAVIRSF